MADMVSEVCGVLEHCVCVCVCEREREREREVQASQRPCDEGVPWAQKAHEESNALLLYPWALEREEERE